MITGVRRFVIGIACAGSSACAVYDSSLLRAAQDGETGVAGSGGSGGSVNAGGYAGSGSGAGGASGFASAGTTGESGGTAGRPSARGGEGGVLDGGAGGGGVASIGGSGISGTSGSGGSGGMSSCGAHLLTPTASWTGTASSSAVDDPPSHAIDGDSSDRWSTGKLQSSTEWFQLDFGATVSIDEVTLMLGSSNALDYPRAYAVRFSKVTNNANAPVLLTGTGQPNMDTILSFASPVTGRYLFITQTGTTGSSFWSIAEIVVACNN